MSSTDQSGFRALAQLVAVSLLGLVAAPALLDTPLSPLGSLAPGASTNDVAWLALALLLVVWLIAITPALTRGLAAALFRRLPVQPSRPREDALRLDASRFARWSIVAACFLVAQAALRRPLSLVLDTRFAVASSDSIVPACSLGLLLIVIWRLHGAARPLIEASARNLLDTLLAADGSVVRTDSARPASIATGDAASSPDAPLSSGGAISAPGHRLSSPTGETTREPPATDRPVAASFTGEAARTGEATRFEASEAPASKVLSTHDEALSTDTGEDTLDSVDEAGVTVQVGATAQNDDESTRTVG